MIKIPKIETKDARDFKDKYADTKKLLEKRSKKTIDLVLGTDSSDVQMRDKKV